MQTNPLMETLEPRLLLDGVWETSAAERVIDFAGMPWAVRAGDPAVEGDNWYTDSEAGVWVDDAGLNLKLTSNDGTWYAVEVATMHTTLPGAHRFYLTGRPDLLDANVRVELSLVGSAGAATVRFGGEPDGTYVWTAAGGAVQEAGFDVALNGTTSTHIVQWSAGEIAFSSHHWHSPEPSTPAHLISQWQYAGPDVFDVGDDVRIHLRLFLDSALPPTDLEEVAMVIAAVDVPNHAPTIQTVYAEPDWLLEGETLTVVAGGVVDVDGTVTSVAFYRDDNGDGVGQPSELLGVDTDGTDGWSWSGEVDWAPGTYTLLAQATDNLGVTGPWAVGEVTIAEQPEFYAVIGNTPDADSRVLTFTDPDGSLVRVRLNSGQATLGFVRPAVELVPGDGGVVITSGVRLVEISLSDTTRRSQLIIQTRGGLAPGVEIGRITGTDPLGRLFAPHADLVGSGVAMTGDGYILITRVRDLLHGADIRMEGTPGRPGLALVANAVGPDSVIDIVRGPVRGMRFTGEFNGIVATGVSRGSDGLWFTDDDVVTHDVRVGAIRIHRPGVGVDGEPFGVLGGPSGAQPLVPRVRQQFWASGSLETRLLPGPNADITILRVRGAGARRAVLGRADDVAPSQHKVVLYTRHEPVWTLTATVGVNRLGRWVARRVGDGDLLAYLVRSDFDVPAVLTHPLEVDGLAVVTEVVIPV